MSDDILLLDVHMLVSTRSFERTSLFEVGVTWA